jgi:two-component system nitrogen regulation response regulator NtrX
LANLLIVDDESSIRGVLVQLFEFEGHRAVPAASGPAALEALGAEGFDAVFLDVKMPGMDGLDVLARIKEKAPSTPVIMISGHGTIDTAVEATRRGAFDFLQKPLDTDRLLLTLRNALERKGLRDSVEALRSAAAERDQIVGESAAIRAVLDRIGRVANTDARVLITGENGTGKELVARAIHRGSPRWERAFVEVNCAAIPAELIESELFGHVRGSFTGAVQDRAGTFEQAHGGTLFLDEIGDMAPAAQAKVLRALEEGRVTRVGGHESRAVDVRVVAATNKDLAEEIAEGRFREDLFYRLNVVPIHVPPLRERRDDIPALVRHFEAQISPRIGVQPRRFTPEAIEALGHMDWPGNIRELRNTVERLLILASGPDISRADVLGIGGGSGSAPRDEDSVFQATTFAEFRERSERRFLELRLAAFDWNVSETARAMEMPRSNLYKKIERFGLQRMAGNADEGVE